MKDLGYSKGYRYAHDYKEGYAAQDYLPESIAGSRYYFPVARGYEKMIAERLNHWRSLKEKAKKKE